MSATINDRLRRILSDHLCFAEAKTLDDRTSLQQGLGLDSLDAIELALIVKNEFGIDVIRDNDAWETMTLPEIAAAIQAAAEAQRVPV